MIKQYQDQAAHDAATRSTTESEASLLLNTRECLIDGVNVKISLAPKVGDIVCYDANKKVKFIALDTYKALPSGWTAMGVVAARHGNKLMIVNKANASKKFADVYTWKVTGYNLDGASHSVTFTLHDSAIANAFTYTASTLANFVSQLQAWLNNYAPSGYTYSAYIEGEDVILQLNNYSAATGTTSASGLTLTANTATEIDYTGSIWRRTAKGVKDSSYFGHLNRWRYADYYANSGADPTTDVTVESDPVKLSAFQNNSHCAALRTAYCADPTHPTREDYNNYIFAKWKVNVAIAIDPCMKGIIGNPYRDGKAQTYALAGVKYTATDSSRKDKYPAAAYAASIGYAGVKGFEAGDWFVPSVYEGAEIFRDLTQGTAFAASRDKADAVNRSLYAIGGSAIAANALAWFMGRSSGANAWGFGGYGVGNIAYGYSFCGSYTVVPCVLYELSDSEA